MTIGDIRYTVLQIVNEVQRKLDLTQTPSLTTNKLATSLVDFINDTCNDLSDFGNWHEMLVSANVTAVSGQSHYSINTSANIKNVGDLFFTERTGPLTFNTIQDMRIMTRVSSQGVPSQYTLGETDSNGNPILWVRPTPNAQSAGGLFSFNYYIRTPQYTTSDAAVVVPFPARVVVMGVLARYLLNESGGAPTDRYSVTQQDYITARKEALNRFKGDTGYEVKFTPSMQTRWRRK